MSRAASDAPRARSLSTHAPLSRFGVPLFFVLLVTLHLAANAWGAADELFAPIARVMTHPRCLNCHTSTDYPRQGDDRHRHLFLVVRGDDNRGAPGAHCGNCHGGANQSASGVPGAPGWRLAPLDMAWEGTPGVAMDNAGLCRRLLDRQRNGGRDSAALERHMTEEPLVAWAWAPGKDRLQEGRAPPPLSQADFIAAFRAWRAAGAPCPE